MSTKDWKNKELNGLLNERWGFSMDLSKLNEGSCGSHKKDDTKSLEEEEKCPHCEGKGCPHCAAKNEAKEDDSDGKFTNNNGKKEKCDYVDCGDKEEVNEKKKGLNPKDDEKNSGKEK